jgi:hypothetical protein
VVGYTEEMMEMSREFERPFILASQCALLAQQVA